MGRKGTQRNGRYGITVLHTPPKPNISFGAEPMGERAVYDLVAIHGLNGDYMDTWTDKRSGIMWLRDLLPLHMPNIRTMTFGYNAHFKSYTKQPDLRSIANKLLAELVDLRQTEEEKSRPIILICHSLGGIVAKKAMLMGCAREQVKVQKSVYGIIFLGTPHKGSSLALLGRVASSVVARCSPVYSPRQIMTKLQKNSGGLRDIAEDFVQRHHELQLFSFHETQATPVAPFIKRMIVEQRSATLNLPYEEVIGQHCNHRDIARFESEEDRNFRPLLNRLKSLEQDVIKATSTEDRQQQTSLILESQALLKNSSIDTGDRITLELPSLPYDGFQGREDVMDKMEKYFFTADFISSKRSVFAICGLGGMGKTETALKFLVENKSKYSTGVMLVNASTKESLNADFSRIHGLLNLPESDNKANAVKRWLAGEKHQQWLLVIDNADDLATVPILSYVPAVPWGDVIVTTRDQGAIGSITQDGVVLEPLGCEDATAALFKAAGIVQPNDEDFRSAQDIVRDLGSLPIAVIQAGAFMRSMNKSPQEYLLIYRKERDQVLHLKPRLVDSDKTVMSVWEINFKQIELESSDAADLLLLFCFLEPSRISWNCLQRGSMPQKRWGSDGEITQVTPQSEGVDESVVALLKNDFRFDLAIEKLQSFSLISCARAKDKQKEFSLHPLVQYCAQQRLTCDRARWWKRQALQLVCHAFPRTRFLEPLNGEIGRAILPQLSHILTNLDKDCRSAVEGCPFRQALASAFLASSYYSDSLWKEKAITLAKQLMEGDLDAHMNLAITLREHTFLRAAAKHADARKIKQALMRQQRSFPLHEPASMDARLNALNGLLSTQLSEDIADSTELEEAGSRMLAWAPLDKESPSTFEKITAFKRDITLGNWMGSRGDFRQALAYLQDKLVECYNNPFFDGTGWYRIWISTIAELLCEIGQPEAAEDMVKKELLKMTVQGCQDIDTGRRLQLALAESYISRRMFGQAEAGLLTLKNLYEKAERKMKLSDKRIFRVWVGLARLCHYQARWREADEYWEKASNTLVRLKMHDDFSADLVQLSRAHILHVCGDKQGSHELLAEIQSGLGRRAQVHWIAGFDSCWRRDMVQSMRAECTEPCGMEISLRENQTKV